MRRQAERVVTYEEFLRTALELRCGAPSVLERPRVGELCRAYTSTVADLLAGETYPAQFIHEQSGKLVDWNDARESPLTLRQLVATADILDAWRSVSGESHHALPYLTLHCAGCDRLVVVDGMQRLAWLAAKEECSQPLFVVELSGYRWRREAPDMGAVCACR